ncbi:hypothetical protein SLE2022_019170 [Rubroshorea leprosula]
MHAIWASLKENVNCVSKLTDAVARPENCSKKNVCSLEKQNLEKQIIHQLEVERPFREVLFRPNYPRTQFHELKTGDTSRNVVEMIFQRASMEPSKPPKKIKRVLRVKNSVEVVERFEKYREKVMKNAYEKNKRHPRSMVDGNELLLFFGTTMACCSSRNSKLVSQLCIDPSCRVCRIIHSKFDMEFTRKNGIQLSTRSEELSDTMVTLQVKKNMRAVIVCRTIAGRIANTVDGIFEEYDSIGREGLNSSLEYLIVRNPCAILPCFVIVFT